MLSVTRPDSELARLNAQGSAAVSAETEKLIERAQELSRECGGAFDIRVSPAVAAWGFYDDRYRIPDETELAALVGRIEGGELRAEDGTILVSPGTALDLGAIAKGYASQRICEILRSGGVRSALVYLGGNVQVMGAKPDGSDWKIALQNPDGSDEHLGFWQGKDCAVVTSGDYQRYFERSGVRYHHILDPRTAAPARSGLRSVTVICPDPVKADAWSTALFVMGEERALEFWREQGDFEAVLYTEDGRLLVTGGLGEAFVPLREAEVIDR